MTKTPKTLTLSVKTARPSSAPLVVPKTTLSYVIDNAQEAASKVTVVKKKTRLSSATIEPVATMAAAAESDAPARTVKLARKPGDAGDAAATAEMAVPVVRTAPKSKLVKAVKEPAPVVISTGGTTVSQVTDAATLASIDTSGYLLPSVKVPGRRGRKPSEFTPENDEVAALNAVERAELKAVSKARERKAKGGAELLGLDNKSTAEELERRRAQIKNLINMGKERGFLTYAEINDQLPENIIDPEAIEGIIATFNDMGIAIYERAPDAESLLLSDSVATVTSDDEVEAAAATALSTVDSDFGRTTDPVRMYMREMGAVALLTREGEIEIAKRIEGGLKDMIQAISACPTTIAEILALAGKIEADEMKVDDVVDGFVDANESAPAPVVAAPAASDDDEEEELEVEEEEETDGAAGGGAAGFSTEQLAQLKKSALEKFAHIESQFEKMRKAAGGYGSKAYVAAQETISAELLGIRFTAKVVEKLCDTLRGQMEEVRSIERAVLDLCVNRCGMPRAHFIKVFPGNETDLDWVDGEVDAGYRTAPCWVVTCLP